MRRSTGVTDLTGADRASGAPGRPTHVWYVSYGSNLLRERFEVYLLGGRVAGLDLSYPGGPGAAPASAERPVVLPGRLRFALDAPPWGGGGVAFWDPDPDPDQGPRTGPGAGVLARAWRVTLDQYLEVVHLENGGADRAAAAWPAEVLTTGSAVLDDGWYGRLVLAGHVAGEPALTFTHPEPHRLITAAPSGRYEGTVRRGLVETFGGQDRGGLDEAEARAYLAAACSQA